MVIINGDPLFLELLAKEILAVQVIITKIGDIHMAAVVVPVLLVDGEQQDLADHQVSVDPVQHTQFVMAQILCITLAAVAAVSAEEVILAEAAPVEAEEAAVSKDQDPQVKIILVVEDVEILAVQVS